MTSSAAERFQAAVDLHQTGLALQRQNIRRRRPDLTEAEVDEALSTWLADRPLDHPST